MNHLWKTEEEGDSEIEKWLKNYLERFKELQKKSVPFWKMLLHVDEDKQPEERNDVIIYKTLKYPPKATPPTPN